MQHPSLPTAKGHSHQGHLPRPPCSPWCLIPAWWRWAQARFHSLSLPVRVTTEIIILIIQSVLLLPVPHDPSLPLARGSSSGQARKAQMSRAPGEIMGWRKIWTLILFPWWETNINHFFFFEHSCSLPARLGGLEASPQAELGSGRATSAPITWPWLQSLNPRKCLDDPENPS